MVRGRFGKPEALTLEPDYLGSNPNSDTEDWYGSLDKLFNFLDLRYFIGTMGIISVFLIRLS